MTGASEATISRILNEFDERGWAERNDDGEYIATPEGQHIAVQFQPFASSIQTIQTLDAALAMIPATELRVGQTDTVIGLKDFRDVTVHRPSPYEDNPLSGKLIEQVNESTVHHVLTYYTLDTAVHEAMYDRVTDGQLTSKAILASGNIDHIYDPDRSPPANEELREILESLGGGLYRYDGRFPCNLWIGDDRVLLENAQAPDIEPMTTLESHNEKVRQWALDVWETYRAKSEEVTPDELFE